MDWKEPLKKAIMERLSENEISGEELRMLREQAIILSAPEIFEKIDRKTEEIQKEFERCKASVEEEKNIDLLKNTRQFFEQHSEFGESEALVKRCDERIAGLENEQKKKQRRKSVMCAAALLCVVLGIAGFVFAQGRLYNTQVESIREQMAQHQYAQAYQLGADLGWNYWNDTESGLMKELMDQYVAFELEANGVDGMLNLLQNFLDAGTMKAEERKKCVRECWTEKLAAFEKKADGAALMVLFELDEKEKIVSQQELDTIYQCAVKYIAAGELRDDMAEIIGKIYRLAADRKLTIAPLPVDDAIRISKALQEKEADLGALFPKGIPVDLKAQRYAGKLDAYWTKEIAEFDTEVGCEKILPVSIAENQDELIVHKKNTWMSEQTMEDGVRKMKSRDEHYEVCFLPAQYFRLPEDLRADSLAECDTFAARIVQYVLIGSVYEKETTTYSNKSSYTSYSYFPFFTEVDAVVLFDTSERAGMDIVVSKSHKSLAEDANVKGMNVSRFMEAKFMLGGSDSETLDADFGDCIDTIGLIRLLNQLGLLEEQE